jgi:elongation factor 2
MPEAPEPHDRDLDDNWIKIILDEPLVVYREKISQQSKDFHTKSANRHNRMLMHIEPLDKKTEKLIEEGRIHDLLDVKQRAIILREEAGWDAGEAIQIVDVYNGNILVNGTSGLQRFNRI